MAAGSAYRMDFDWRLNLSSAAAIQGEQGSNSAVAARALLGDEVRLVCCQSFADVFVELDQGRVTQAVLPVENTTAGLVQQVWDRLLGITPGPPLQASAEARVRIEFVAAGLPGSAARVRRVLAHPMAAAQCRKFLERSGWEVMACHDTAGAARLVHEQNDPSLAALCPPSAAVTYRLQLLATDCGDSNRTWTRFLLVQPGTASPHPGDDRALLALRLRDRPGALAQSLLTLSTRGLNLCALHSRAMPGSPGQYMFLLELQAGASDPRCLAAFQEIQDQGDQVRLLGSFLAPSWPDLPAPGP